MNLYFTFLNPFRKVEGVCPRGILWSKWATKPIPYVAHLVRRMIPNDKRSNTTMITYILHKWGISVFCGWVKKRHRTQMYVKMTSGLLFPKKFASIGTYVFCENIHWNIGIIMNPHSHDRWQLSSSHIGPRKFLEVFLFHLGSGGTRPRRRTGRPTTPHPPLSSFTSFKYSQCSAWSWWMSESWHWHIWPSTHIYDNLTGGLCDLSYTRSSR